jgi:hypothetical protein
LAWRDLRRNAGVLCRVLFQGEGDEKSEMLGELKDLLTDQGRAGGNEKEARNVFSDLRKVGFLPVMLG